MRRILCATDFSTRSQRALRRAGLIARRLDADLTLLHVVDDDQPTALIDLEKHEAAKLLDETIHAVAELRNVRCAPGIVTGKAFDGILRTAQRIVAHLIVLGRHRKELLQDMFIGTTAERVIRTGSFPVLMVKKEVDRPYARVLAAMDASDVSAHAIKTALSLGLFADVPVDVVHAYLAVGKGRLSVAGVKQDEIDSYLSSEREQAAAELRASLAQHGLHDHGWPIRLEEGRPFEAISRVVSELMPDLLVIGTHGRAGFAKLLLGSVAEEVLRILEVDTLAVPPRLAAAERLLLRPIAH